jgi:hypothetical protein
MNTIIYFFVLILFLILIKTIVFKNEGFHVPPESAAQVAGEQAEETTAEEARQASEAAQQEAETIVLRERLDTTRQEYQDAVAEVTRLRSVGATPVQIAAAIETVVEAQEALNEVETAAELEETVFDGRTTPASTEVPGPSDPLTTEEELARRVRVDHNTGRRTFQASGDNKCCGVDIFDLELEHIGKCVKQHIKTSGELEDPLFVEWKEADNDCRNPHRILSRTSNCSEIANKYQPSIRTLLNLIKDTSCERCDYFRYLQDIENTPQGELTDDQKHLIFQKRVACDLRGRGEIGEDNIVINDVEYPILKCSDDRVSLPVGGDCPTSG